VRSAEGQLRAASASIGVAIAAMLPQFTLTGSAGTTANQINQLFITPGTAFWTFMENVAQTVSDAGTLLHKKRAADGAFDKAAEMYRSTVIAAFQNVADSLHALQSDGETLKAIYAAERAAFRSLEIARRQLQPGAIGYADGRKHPRHGNARSGSGAGPHASRSGNGSFQVGRSLPIPVSLLAHVGHAWILWEMPRGARSPHGSRLPTLFTSDL
jgi:hypothetical protein